VVGVSVSVKSQTDQIGNQYLVAFFHDAFSKSLNVNWGDQTIFPLLPKTSVNEKMKWIIAFLENVFELAFFGEVNQNPHIV
jgi:hypothetical protein